MEIEVTGDEQYGSDVYSKLFEEIMNDLNKAVLIDRVKLVLRPSVPLFVFSIALRAEPGSKSIADVSTVRMESTGVHVTITQERYAPDILAALWARYGRSNVYQQTRFDIDVTGAKESDMAEMIVSSGEEDRREIMGAIWRTMPEGIKNRRTLVDGNVITVIATEEILLPEMVQVGREVHESMGGAAVV
ncbi:MAG: methanogenesis marker 17 protein [Candidatus Methanomethylophilaceae archaeon]|nr:methanogenesis marker 17 protein [Candidatus Methanomethylophilaceae archaeon]